MNLLMIRQTYLATLQVADKQNDAPQKNDREDLASADKILSRFPY